MTQRSTAIILRFQEGSTDKVWVICPHAAPNGDHQVFWGATSWTGNRSKPLQSKVVSGSADSRINQKRRGGYDDWQGVAFDENNACVIRASTQPVPKPPANFWYRIDPSISTVDLASFLDDVSIGLAVYESESNSSGWVDYFNALSLTAALRAGDYSGTSEYSESPMAALLLYSIRRAWKSLVLVSDDANEMIPDRLDDLYILLSNEHLFGNMPDHWVAKVFKQVAIAMLCIDRPVDLASLHTETAPAFF